MKEVWKYPLDGQITTTVLYIPRGGKILTLQLQDGVPCLYLLVDPGQPDELRHFRFFASVQPVPEHWTIYVGTLQFNGGTFVYHLFEKGAS